MDNSLKSLWASCSDSAARIQSKFDISNVRSDFVKRRPVKASICVPNTSVDDKRQALVNITLAFIRRLKQIMWYEIAAVVSSLVYIRMSDETFHGVRWELIFLVVCGVVYQSVYRKRVYLLDYSVFEAEKEWKVSHKEISKIMRKWSQLLKNINFWK